MIYLDNAATSYPKPGQVIRAVTKALDTLTSPGRGAYETSRKASHIVYRTREALSELFNIDNPERIVFCQNATMAINMAIFGLIHPGEKFMVSSMEHNSVMRPAKLLGAGGNDVLIVQAQKDGIIRPDDVKKQLKKDTKLLCLIHASNVCGSINDIEKIGRICKDNGTIFMVDAAQSAGLLPIDVVRMNIDLLAFPGHKGLLGPQGTGGLYVGKNVSLRPIIAGGTGSLSENLSQPDFLPDRLESGTLNVPGIAGLCAGVEYILKNTVELIRQKEIEKVKMLIEDFSVIPGVKILGTDDPDKRAQAVSVVTKKDTSDVAAMLDSEYKICVRAGLLCAPIAHKTLGSFESGAVRFSPGIFTTKNDIKKAAFALSRIMR